ncbi:MAG: hypothetical protein ACOH12_05585 [Parvibaculaceae bacterium]
MSITLRVLVVCGLLMGVTGCGKRAMPAVPFDPVTIRSVKTIGLLTPGVSSEANAIIAKPVGTYFGAIGMLVDAGVKDSRDEDLTRLLIGQSFDAQKTLTESLTKALEGRGYKVIQVALSRENPVGIHKNYVGASAPVDAYLDVTLTYGYIAANAVGDSPYRPFARSDIRLVQASDKSVLMKDRIYYNTLRAPRNAVTIQADAAYSFAGFSDVTGDPVKATKGVGVAVAAVADTIAGLLK